MLRHKLTTYNKKLVKSSPKIPCMWPTLSKCQFIVWTILLTFESKSVIKAMFQHITVLQSIIGGYFYWNGTKFFGFFICCCLHQDHFLILKNKPIKQLAKITQTSTRNLQKKNHFYTNPQPYKIQCSMINCKVKSSRSAVCGKGVLDFPLQTLLILNAKNIK